MDWRDIPSLAALRAFDATARAGGFSAAARALNVTHAAIAQHVRSLEADFGCDLVERQGRTMILTPAGEILAQGLEDGFATIHDTIHQLRDRDAEAPVGVTVTPSFAENWLMPRLGDFRSRHPDIRVALHPSVDVVSLRRGAIDLGIRYGRGTWPGVDAERLINTNFIVVGQPKFQLAKPATTLHDLLHLPWLLDREQAKWCDSKGMPRDKMNVTDLATNQLTLAGLRAGYGVSVQPEALVKADLDSGTLVTLFADSDPDIAYHMVMPPGPRRSGTETFAKWLRHQERMPPMLAKLFDETPCSLGEGPIWHPERGTFFWFDILASTLYSRDGDKRLKWEFSEFASAAGWIDRDTLLVATASALVNLNLETRASDVVVQLEADNPLTRSNDGRADPFGGFWIGTMGRNAEDGAGAIYRYYRGELRQLFAPLTIPNAICFSPDGDLAYFADSMVAKVWRQRLDGEGWPQGEPELFLDLAPVEAVPDGAVIDADGAMWNAQWGAAQVVRYLPDGREDSAIDLPTAHTTCPAFGGADGTTLMVTTARQGLDTADLAEQPEAGMSFLIEKTGYKGRPSIGLYCKVT